METESSLRSFLLALPKAELHVHLEGSIPPATLLRLGRRHRVELPADDEAGLARWFAFRDFPHFVEVYLTLSRCLREAEDFYDLALDFLGEQARQNVVWSEVHFTISTHLANGGDGEAIRQALQRAAREGERRWGVRVGWIPDIVRNAPRERAEQTLAWMAREAGRGEQTGNIVALGLAGMEAGHPPEPFAPFFEQARALGFHTVAHAGEHGPPESVRAAIEVLGAERIGHGVAAAQDPTLMAELARRGIPLEVCPSSNVCLGVAANLGAHPFDRLRRAGVQLSVGSDDPPLFGTTLIDEYLRLAAAFGYGAADLTDLVLAGIEQSFLPADERAALGKRVREVASAFVTKSAAADGPRC